MLYCRSGKSGNYHEQQNTNFFWTRIVRFAAKAPRHDWYDTKLNMIYITSQGKGGSVLNILEEVLLLEHKVAVLAWDLTKGTVSHLSVVREIKQAHMVTSSWYLQSAIITMQILYGSRFSEFSEKNHNDTSCSIHHVIMWSLYKKILFSL